MALKKWPEGLPRKGNLNYVKITPVNNWFEIFKINENTYALLEPDHDEEVFSYLLIGSNKAALIDTGMGIANIRTEVENITSLPVIVLNTHTHFDHTGDNFRFEEISCFDNSFEISNLNKGHNNKFCSNFMQPASYRNIPQGFNPESYEVNPSTITRKLKHLEQIDIGDRLVIIHHTPGHSPGSICIEDTKYNLLFTGDTYYRGTIFLQLPGSNPQQFNESCEYLTGITGRIESLCPGHNECFAPKEDIILLHKILNDIDNDKIEYDINNESRFYQFENFNIRMPLNN